MHTRAPIELLSLGHHRRAGRRRIMMTSGGACAVCKHQRRKCEPNCELAAYFPANRMNDFRALHLVFGVANLTKLVVKANATEPARRRAAETLTWEALWRERDPSEGCYREVAGLRRENAVLRSENAALRRQFASYGGGVAGGCYNSNNGSAAPANGGVAQQSMMFAAGCYTHEDRYLCCPAGTAVRSDAAITMIRGNMNNPR